MTGGWAATNTLREAVVDCYLREIHAPGYECLDCAAYDDGNAALALVEAALDAAARAFEGWEDPGSHNWQDALDALGPALRAVWEGK